MTNTAQASADPSLDALQVLTFVLDDDCFGTSIHLIQEVLEYRDVTKVPRTPDFMLGVINLRGQVVPVVDLRTHFAMTAREPTVDTCIIIVDVEVDGESTGLGIVADRVLEVVEFEAGAVRPPPRIGNRIDSRYIQGMVARDDRFVILLNLAKVFAADELLQVLESAEAAPADTPADGDDA